MPEPGRPAQLPRRQFLDLRRYLAEEVHPYLPAYRRCLDDAGVDSGRIAGYDEFTHLPIIDLDDVGTGNRHLMTPTREAIRSRAPLALRMRATWALLTLRRERFEHDLIAPRYQPVVWTREHRLRIGWTVEDLRRLGELGRRLLERAGVRHGDRMVTVGLDQDRLGFWQLSLGARAGGVSALHLRDAERGVIRDGEVTVVAGTRNALDDLFVGLGGNSIHTVIVIGPPLDARQRSDLAERSGATVLQAWAPPGVRSLWGEGRDRSGLVIEPSAGIVEIVDPDDRPVADGTVGEVVWSALGWAGTVLLRLRTGVMASRSSSRSRTGIVTIDLAEDELAEENVVWT